MENEGITWGYSMGKDEYIGPTIEQIEETRQKNYKRFMYQRMLETPEQWYKREIEELIGITKSCIKYHENSAVTDEMRLEGMLRDYEGIKKQYEIVKKNEPERLKQVEHVQKLLKGLDDGK